MGNPVANLQGVGLQFNVLKPRFLTTQALPPSQLQTPNGLDVNRETTHNWFGRMLSNTAVQFRFQCQPMDLLSTENFFPCLFHRRMVSSKFVFPSLTTPNIFLMCVAALPGSTNFTMGPAWNISGRSPTFSFWVETSVGAMDCCCYESETLGSTVRIVHRTSLYTQRFGAFFPPFGASLLLHTKPPQKQIDFAMGCRPDLR